MVFHGTFTKETNLSQKRRHFVRKGFVRNAFPHLKDVDFQRDCMGEDGLIKEEMWYWLQDSLRFIDKPCWDRHRRRYGTHGTSDYYRDDYSDGDE